MISNRIVEYTFFFGLLAVVAYIVWQLISPFMSALALAAIIVTISFPLYERLVQRMPHQNQTLGALLTTLIATVVILFPLIFIASSLVREAVSVYAILDADQVGLSGSLESVEVVIQEYLPAFELNATEYMQQTAQWLAGSFGAIFTGTASTIFLFFIALIGAFYFFRDGKVFTKRLVKISPLPDDEDELILQKLAQAVRSVTTGVVMIAIIQGTLTAIGLSIAGFERAILWGAIAAFGALIPSIGTSIIFIPAFIYLIVTGEYFWAGFIAIWGTTAVGLIDNLLGPYLIGRGSSLHPFLVLLAVLGGISVFGPIGFIVGPVIVSLFLVLLDLYSDHIANEA